VSTNTETEGATPGPPDDAAARSRLEALFARIDRLIPDDLAHLGLATDAQAGRAGARATAQAAVNAARLDDLATEARAAARDRLIERWAGGLYRPTWMGALNWGVSTGRASDRAEVIGALEDAALAAVAGDLVDEQTIATLSGDGDAVLALATGGPAEESLATAVHAATVARTPLAAAGLTAVVMLVVASGVVLFGGPEGAGTLATAAVLVVAATILALVIRRARRMGRGGPGGA